MSINMMTLFTTNECNLNCIYCSTNAKHKLENELAIEEKKDVILQAKRMGTKMITLCGSGEPMLDKDFYELVEFCHGEKLYTELVTNGSLITKENSKWLIDRNVLVVFKMNSFKKEISEKLVGKKNAYNYVLHDGYLIPEGLKFLMDAGYSKLKRKLFFCAPFQIQCVISSLNYKEIPKIADFCKKNNIYFFLESLIWDGRAAKNHNLLEIDKKKYNWLQKKLIGKVDLGFFLHQKRVSCELEKNPVIDAQGNYRICYSRSSNIGNIREKSLKQLFDASTKIRKKHAVNPIKGILNDNCFKTCPGREYIKKQFKKG